MRTATAKAPAKVARLKYPRKPAVHPHAKDIDRLGYLKDYLEEWTTEKDEFEALKKKLIYAANEEGQEDAELILRGNDYTLVLSSCVNERKVEDLSELFDRLGKEAFIRCVGAKLAELDKLKMDLSDLITVKRGSRKLKTIVRNTA